MIRFSRRDLLATLAKTGASAFAWRSSAGLLRAETTQKLPVQMSDAARQNAKSKLAAYFGDAAPKLLRPAQGVLLQPWVSPSLPGKAYNTQLWDWDTYWTSRGLFHLAHASGYSQLHGEICQHAQGSLLNFLDHQSEEGRIPTMISVSDPDPFGCLKKECPNIKNQAKPIMGQLALLIADEQNDVEWVRPRFDRLLRFHDSWTLGNQSSIGLLVWGEDVAIGVDNDPTTFGRPFFSSADLLLNCLFYQDLQAAAELARRLGRTDDQQRLSNQARNHGANIQRYCWDPRDHFYYTVDVQCVDRRAELIPRVPRGMDMSWKCLPLRIQMFTGFLPLWCGLATPQQASEIVQRHCLNDSSFHSAYGIRSLSEQETMYSLARSSNPSNWLGPIWIVVNYFVWKGLKNYGFHQEAADLANKTLRLLSSDLNTSGSLNEYYDPDTGAPLSHPGFLDWNMLVLEMTS